MIPTSIDGTDITGATIDGSDVQEITVDGDVVFSAGPDFPSSVVNRWPFDEGSGSTVTDVIGGDNGSITGATWVSDNTYIGGSALSFDGSNDFVFTGATMPAGSMTLLATIDFTTNINAERYIHGAQNGAQGRYIRFDNGSNNQLQFVFFGSNAFEVINHNLPGPGRYRVAGVIDTNANEGHIAVNGNIEQTITISGPFTTTLSNHAIGKRPDSTSSKIFLGEIDEPIIANDAYTAPQLLDDYNRQPWS